MSRYSNALLSSIVSYFHWYSVCKGSVFIQLFMYIIYVVNVVTYTHNSCALTFPFLFDVDCVNKE